MFKARAVEAMTSSSNYNHLQSVSSYSQSMSKARAVGTIPPSNNYLHQQTISAYLQLKPKARPVDVDPDNDEVSVSPPNNLSEWRDGRQTDWLPVIEEAKNDVERMSSGSDTAFPNTNGSLLSFCLLYYNMASDRLLQFVGGYSII